MAEVAAYPEQLNDSSMDGLVRRGRYHVVAREGVDVALPMNPMVDPVYRFDIVFQMWCVIEGPQVP